MARRIINSAATSAVESNPVVETPVMNEATVNETDSVEDLPINNNYPIQTQVLFNKFHPRKRVAPSVAATVIGYHHVKGLDEPKVILQLATPLADGSIACVADQDACEWVEAMNVRQIRNVRAKRSDAGTKRGYDNSYTKLCIVLREIPVAVLRNPGYDPNVKGSYRFTVTTSEDKMLAVAEVLEKAGYTSVDAIDSTNLGVNPPSLNVETIGCVG